MGASDSEALDLSIKKGNAKALELQKKFFNL